MPNLCEKFFTYFSSSSDHEMFPSHKAYLNVDCQHSGCLFREDICPYRVDYHLSWKSNHSNAFEDGDDVQGEGASLKFLHRSP